MTPPTTSTIMTITTISNALSQPGMMFICNEHGVREGLLRHLWPLPFQRPVPRRVLGPLPPKAVQFRLRIARQDYVEVFAQAQLALKALSSERLLRPQESSY